MEKKDWKKKLRELSFMKGYYFKLEDNGLVEKKDDRLVFNRKDLEDFISSEIEKAREEGDIASDFLYWHPLGGGMPDSSIRIGVEFEVGGCYEDWGFVIEQNGRTISSGRTLKEAISKLKDSK